MATREGCRLLPDRQRSPLHRQLRPCQDPRRPPGGDAPPGQFRRRLRMERPVGLTPVKNNLAPLPMVRDYFLFPLPELLGRHALHALEEAGEGGGFGEVEPVGNLVDAERGLPQKEGGFHEEHLVDVVDDGASA